jgi:integrase
MNSPIFSSAIASSISSLVAMRQSLGYEDESFVKRLRLFDHFLVDRCWAAPSLTREVIVEWVSSGEVQPSTRALRSQAMKVLARYIAQTMPDSYVPGPSFGWQRQSSFRPHIYTVAEIEALLDGAATLPPAGSLRPLVNSAILGLLYCSGLRVSEALALTIGDVDLTSAVVTVRDSKFHKSRAVPLHPDGVGALQRYRHDRDQRRHRTEADAPFFINQRGVGCSYSSTVGTFLGIARRAGLRGPPGTRGPRIHDLRHTFAVHRLLDWYRDGGDVQLRLPLLSTYMGHVSLVSTQVYLEITAELLAEAARRFRAPSPPSHSTGGIES